MALCEPAPTMVMGKIPNYFGVAFKHRQYLVQYLNEGLGVQI